MSFVYLKRGCPICEGDRGDCRENSESKVIHCRSGNEPPEGWRHIGIDRIGFSMYRQGDGESVSLDSIEKRHERQRAKAQKLAGALALDERDRLYQRIAQQSGLSQRHRQLLIGRGFSEEHIDRLVNQQLVFSWQDGLELAGLPENLAGIHEGALRHFGNKIAIAVPNHLGQIVGLQIWNPDNPEAKYIWVSSEKVGGYGPQLPSGELPITVHGQGQNLWLCDSVGFKPIVAAARHDIQIAGSPSGLFASYPKQFEALVQEHQQIIYAPDAGDAQNPNLIREIRKIHQAIADQGKELKIAWWGQTEKPGLDIDEVETDQIELISWSQWLEITGEDQTESPWLSEVSLCDLIITNDPKIADQAHGRCHRVIFRHSFRDLYEKKNKQVQLDPKLIKTIEGRTTHIVSCYNDDPRRNYWSDFHGWQLGTAIEFQSNLASDLGFDIHSVRCLSLDVTSKQIEAESAIPNAWWKEARKRSETRYYKELTQSRTPNLSINERFLPENILQTNDGNLAIESATGTGKTSRLREAQEVVHENGGQIIHLSFLDSALSEAADELNLTNINQFDENDWDAALQEGLGDISLNLQALYKLTPERIMSIPHHSLLFIDEVNGVLKELAQGSTLKGKRSQAIQNLRDLTLHIIMTGGRIVVAQNRIYGIALDKLEGITGLEFKFIQNKHPGEERTITFVQGTLADAAQYVSQKREQGLKVFNPSSSQRFTEQVSMLEEMKGRGGETLRLDKKTRDRHKQFYVNPTDYIRAKDLGLFSYTATWGLGGNLLANRYFDEAIACCHSLDLETNVQAIARDRSGMDLTIFTLKAQPPSYAPIFAEDIIYRKYTKSKATLDQYYPAATVQGLLMPSSEPEAKLDLLAAQFQAITNYERKYLKDCLEGYYRDRGFEVKMGEIPPATGLFKLDWKEAHTQCVKQETHIGITAPNELIKDAAKANAILASSQSTYQLKVAANNFLRLEDLPGIPIKEARFYREVFVENDGEFLNQVKWDWGSQNLEVVRILEKAKLDTAIDSGECVQAAMDFWYKKAELLHYLKLTELCNRSYTREDYRLLEVYERCVDYREEIRLYFDLEVSPNESPVRTVNKLLRKLHGFDVEQVKCVGSNGNQLRVYQVGDRRKQTRHEVCQALEIKVSRIVSGKKYKDSDNQYSLDYLLDQSFYSSDIPHLKLKESTKGMLDKVP